MNDRIEAKLRTFSSPHESCLLLRRRTKCHRAFLHKQARSESNPSRLHVGYPSEVVVAVKSPCSPANELWLFGRRRIYLSQKMKKLAKVEIEKDIIEFYCRASRIGDSTGPCMLIVPSICLPNAIQMCQGCTNDQNVKYLMGRPPNIK